MVNINILVVDDQHLVRTGLVRMLGDMRGFTIVGEAESGEQALEEITQLIKLGKTPDVVLMDLRMPGLGGLETTRRLTLHYPEIKVIAVSGCSENPFPQRFIEYGALGFVTKDSVIEEVALAIQSVHRGKKYISQEIAQDMALGSVNSETNDSPFEHLSERELQIALMVIDGVKTSIIAEKIHVSPKTVNTYRYRLFEKLNINSNMELALMASRYGLVDQGLIDKDLIDQALLEADESRK